MSKNPSAAPAPKGGKAGRKGANAGANSDAQKPASQELQQPGSNQQSSNQEQPQPQPDNQSSASAGQDSNVLEAGANGVDVRLVGESGAATGGQHGPTEAVDTGASAVSSIASLIGSIPGLEVTSSQAGFRRAGRAWTTTPTVIKLSELTEDQVHQLLREPMLKVKPVYVPDQEA